MTQDEFISWRNDPVTTAVFMEIRELISDGKDELALVAGENPISDAKRVGKLLGLQSILDIAFSDLEEV